MKTLAVAVALWLIGCGAEQKCETRQQVIELEGPTYLVPEGDKLVQRSVHTVTATVCEGRAFSPTGPTQ